MKKIVSLIVIMTMLLSLAACGAKPAANDVQDVVSTEVSNKTESNSNAEEALTPAVKSEEDAKYGFGNPVHEVFTPAYSSLTGAYATISIEAKMNMESDAWVGLCPDGVDYYDEREADDVDVIWFSADYREDGDPYVFACDFSDVEDGTYALVVATSDDEEVGYIAIQVRMTKSGDSIDFDYSDAKLNEAR